MQVLIKIDGQLVPAHSIPLKVFGTIERAKRSLSRFAILLVAAVLSVLIPVFHFILVPGFLTSAFVFGYLKYKEVYSLNLKSFNCPSCQSSLGKSEVNIQNKNYSSRVFCYECRKQIEFTIGSNS